MIHVRVWPSHLPACRSEFPSAPGREFALDVYPSVPERLSRLAELANDLWYSWHRPTRTLYASLDRELWRAVGHNPKQFLRRIDEDRRLEQQIVLGVGGVRALRALGHAPTVWHLNEGHPAFSVLERVRELRPKYCSRFRYRIRAYPVHELLSHPVETGLLTWLE